MILRTATVILLYILVSVSLTGQVDYSWWNEINNWDGVTPWDQYIVKSPGFMGPNALPVPEMKSGKLPDNSHFRLFTDLHFSKGDNTQNMFSSLYLPLAGNKVGLEFYGVLVEHYKNDIATRDQRHSRDFDAIGFSVGDLNIATLITLTRDHNKWPDMLIRIAFRIPSGSNLRGARFTDAPGYHFDLLFSKKLTKRFEITGMAGFYAWQINYNTGRVLYHQNDALLYGAGLVYSTSGISVDGSVAGYSGYVDIKDSPVVLRLKTELPVGKFRCILRFQKGLKKDFKYSTIRLGVQIPIRIDYSY
ncbi:MAG: hypothetical protein IIB05_07955 [Bacteroidetes bacterium]|nr:hypothetical protein [Bacteroidota bacterium]